MTRHGSIDHYFKILSQKREYLGLGNTNSIDGNAEVFGDGSWSLFWHDNSEKRLDAAGLEAFL
tara:strand:- start:63 stop:251 length:189 start_codon:yes stop_codon:yes gene_type:complete